MIDDAALFRRIERRALLLTAAAMTIALLVPGGGAMTALGVLGGAGLSALSYWAIRRGVTGLADAVLRRGAGVSSGRSAAAFILRYALLGVVAYVMIARLFLPPLGLLGGVSVLPLAAGIEVVRRRT